MEDDCLNLCPCPGQNLENALVPISPCFPNVKIVQFFSLLRLRVLSVAVGGECPAADQWASGWEPRAGPRQD